MAEAVYTIERGSTAVIDRSASDGLFAPQAYHRIANPEGRLFVPDEYLHLFGSKGWRAVEI